MSGVCPGVSGSTSKFIRSGSKAQAGPYRPEKTGYSALYPVFSEQGRENDFMEDELTFRFAEEADAGIILTFIKVQTEGACLHFLGGSDKL